MAIGRIPEPGTGIPESIVDAKGDLVTATAADTPARLAVGSNEQRLVADSAAATGLKYVADTTNYAIAAKGDLLVGTAADTLAALTVGTNGHTLVADSATATGLKWAAATGGSLPTAKARQTSVQSISNNTWTKVTYDTEDWDTGSDFASSTFTCDTAGYYQISATVGFDSGTAIDYPRIRIYKNGANENETGINKQEYPLLQINTVVYLAVNDTVEIYIYQDSGTSKNTGNGNRSMWFAVTGIRS